MEEDKFPLYIGDVYSKFILIIFYIIENGMNSQFKFLKQCKLKKTKNNRFV